MRCAPREIRAFLLRLPQAEFVRVQVEGKLVYVSVEGQTWSRVAETIAALHPERIDVMAKSSPGQYPALDGIVLRSVELVATPSSLRLSRRVTNLQTQVSALLQQIEIVKRDFNAELRDVHAAHAKLFRAHLRLVTKIPEPKKTSKRKARA